MNLMTGDKSQILSQVRSQTQNLSSLLCFTGSIELVSRLCEAEAALLMLNQARVKNFRARGP